MPRGKTNAETGEVDQMRRMSASDEARGGHQAEPGRHHVVRRLQARFSAMLDEGRLARHATRFVLVGVMNTIVTLMTIFVMMGPFGCSYVVSNAAGYATGLANSFIWNRRWTFESRGPVARQGLTFFVVFGVSYGVQLAVLVFLTESVRMRVEWAQVVSTGFFSVTNFWGNRHITFRQPPPEVKDAGPDSFMKER